MLVHHVHVFPPPPPLFSRLKYFKIENTPIKDTNGKSKFERMLSFLFAEKWELFALKLSFERNSTLFSSLRIRVLCLFWTNRGNKVSEETWGTFCILYGQGNSVFKRKFLYLWRIHEPFLHFYNGVKENNKMCIWNWFFAMCSADLTCVNGSTIQLVLRELLFRINLWIF